MSTIYSFAENAPQAGALDGTEISPIIQGGVLKQIPHASTIAAPANVTGTTLAVTQAAHAGRVVTISAAAPIAITLPQATGSGATYTFQMQVVATATSHTIKVANATDVMQGIQLALTTASANVIGYGTSATSDTISLNGTTTGGVVGAIYQIRDVKTGFFMVLGYDSPTGSTATPFSATV